MNITDFDRLVYQTLEKKAPHAFLIAYLKTMPTTGPYNRAPEHGMQLEIVATCIENCAGDFDFHTLKHHAEEINLDWDLIVVALANNEDGSVPAIEDCKEWLKDMAIQVRNGNMMGFAIFDAEGNALQPVDSTYTPASGI